MTLRRIGIIGDIHAEDVLLEAALNFFAGENLDAIFCVGDVVDGAGNANRCCELLRQFSVLTVRGNHDRWMLENTMRDLHDATVREELTSNNLSFLRSLSSTRSLQTNAGNLLLCHGMGENDMQEIKPHDEGYALQFKDELQRLMCEKTVRFVVAGHTHQRMVRDFGGLIVINAGTLFRIRQPCVATADFGERWVQSHDFEDGVLVPHCQCVRF
jgi:putative phosphoesterase